MQLGARRALAEHKRAGRSVVVWDETNQRAVELSPDQIPDFDDQASRADPAPAAPESVPVSPSFSTP